MHFPKKMDGRVKPGHDACSVPGAMQHEVLLRRTGPYQAPPRNGPGSAAHHAAKRGALRCLRGAEQPLLRSAHAATLSSMSLPIAAVFVMHYMTVMRSA
jgi:hypothetical protein